MGEQWLNLDWVLKNFRPQAGNRGIIGLHLTRARAYPTPLQKHAGTGETQKKRHVRRTLVAELNFAA
jgi:hypothetical protein